MYTERKHATYQRISVVSNTAYKVRLTQRYSIGHRVFAPFQSSVNGHPKHLKLVGWGDDHTLADGRVQPIFVYFPLIRAMPTGAEI